MLTIANCIFFFYHRTLNAFAGDDLHDDNYSKNTTIIVLSFLYSLNLLTVKNILMIDLGESDLGYEFVVLNVVIFIVVQKYLKTRLEIKDIKKIHLLLSIGYISMSFIFFILSLGK